MENEEKRPEWQTKEKDVFKKINTKHLFLVYRDCPGKWTKEYVRDRLIHQILIHKYGKYRFKTRVEKWVISQKGNDFYCALLLDRIMEIRRKEYLNIDGVQFVYERVNSIVEPMERVKSQGDWIGYGFPGMNPGMKSK